MTPDISVIVVTYNHARFIGEALAGVFGQQLHSHVEVIVSDDASTDGTLDLVARIAAANGRPVRIIRSTHNLNSNMVTVRAIAAAQGRYVAIMDGDDFWTAPDKLARQQRFLERHPDCAVCFHDQIDTDENGRPLAVAVAHRDVSEWTGLDDILVGNYVPGSSPLFRCTALQALPAWVARAPYGDWALLIAAARQGRIGRIPAVLGAYRRHATGAWSGLNERERAEGLVGFYDYLEPHIWSDCRAAVRHIRAGWRANLWLTLERLGDAPAVEAAVAHGIRAGDVSRLRRTADGIEVTTAVGGLALDVIGAPADATPAIGHVDECRSSDGGRTLQLLGWGPFREDDPWPTLALESDALPLEAVVVRLTRADVAAAVAPELRRAGFWLRVRHEQPPRPFRLWVPPGQLAAGPIGDWIAPA